jgi:hypothetical protein
VVSRRIRLLAALLVTAVIATTGAPLVAAHFHPLCAAKQHECGRTAAIAACCCGDQGQSPADSSLVQPRVEARVDTTATPVRHTDVLALATLKPAIAIPTSPPRLCLLDLPTLFATLLI